MVISTINLELSQVSHERIVKITKIVFSVKRKRSCGLLQVKRLLKTVCNEPSRTKTQRYSINGQT